LYEDVSDFWDWTRKDLQPFLTSTRPGVEADLDKVLVQGESAGGTIALVSAFSQPRGFIKAVIATYPVLTLTPVRSKPFFNVPLLPESVLRDYLASIPEGKIVTAATPPERGPVMLSIVQQRRLPEWYGTDEKHDPFKLLENAGEIPHTLIMHGQEDSVVPVGENVEWVAAARKKFGEGRVGFHVEAGAEHGFDGAFPLETDWLQEGLEPVTKAWLGQ
jgi:acetyl esterase/lipase